MEQLSSYVSESSTARRRRLHYLAVYVGLAALLTAALLVAVNSRDGRGGAMSKFPRVLVPGSGSACTGTPGNGFLFSGTADGVSLHVCISQQGNINQIQYPDTAGGHTQIAFDGYCLLATTGLGGSFYRDYSPGSGVSSLGWGPATFTQTAPEIFSVTRNTSDGRFRLTQFIKVNIQPRSVFVGMTVKNLDSEQHSLRMFREVAPAVDGSPVNDQYTQYGRTGGSVGATGHAWDSSAVGSNAMLFGATQAGAEVRTATVANFQAGGCGSYPTDPPGYHIGGNRLFQGSSFNDVVAPNQSVNVGKFVYRML